MQIDLRQETTKLCTEIEQADLWGSGQHLWLGSAETHSGSIMAAILVESHNIEFSNVEICQAFYLSNLAALELVQGVI